MASNIPVASIAAAPMPISEEAEDEDIPVAEDVATLGISAEAAAHNYVECGALVREEEDKVTWADHDFQALYSDKVAQLISTIGAAKGVTYRLRESQEIVLHAIGAGRNVFFLVHSGLRAALADQMLTTHPEAGGTKGGTLLHLCFRLLGLAAASGWAVI